jgi:hypothetical protein
MNLPNGVWDNGEGFREGASFDADYGGHLGYLSGNTTEYSPGVELADIFHVGQTLGGPVGWQPFAWTDKRTGAVYNLLRFQGYLRPHQLGPYPPPPAGVTTTIEDAAFELFIADGVLPNEAPRSLLVHVWATMPKLGPSEGGRFAYPGTLREGLVPSSGYPTLPSLGQPLPGGDPAIPGIVAQAGHGLMSGYIVTRIFQRPEVFAVQRARELRQVMLRMLAAPVGDSRHPPNWPVIPYDPQQPSDLPCAVMGGSFGGLTAQALCVRFPHEFHGGSISVFGLGPRRVLADQFHFEFVAQRHGLSNIGGAYNPEDTLEWGTAFRFMDQATGSKGWDYFNLSTPLRRKRGEFYSAFAMHWPDEDTICHGTDTLPLITGTRTYTDKLVIPGIPLFAFSTVDRRCHDYGFYTTAISGVANEFLHRSQMVDLVPHVVLAHGANPSPTVPPLLPDDGSEDSYAWALDRLWEAPPPPPPPPVPPGTLALDTSFGVGGRTAGAGLCLGNDESLRFFEVSVGGSMQRSIYCGSSDGVVTRFVLNPVTLALDVAAQSAPLAQGISALAVGEFDGGHGGPEVVVGSKQHLFVLDAATLLLVGNRKFALPYEFSRPRRMQIANVFDHFEYNGEEVVFTSLMGHLIVMSGDNFGTMTDLGEPGIQDFAVLSGLQYSWATTTSSVPIALSSHRGHLANVTLNPFSNPQARNPAPGELHAWTEGLEGVPSDIEVVTAPNGGGTLIACLSGAPLRIELFDAQTLQPASMAQHGVPPSLGWSSSPPGMTWSKAATDPLVLDMAPIHSGATLAGFVVLSSGNINWVPISGQPSGLIDPRGKTLDGIPQASRATGLLAADLRSRPGGNTFDEEIVLSTLGGHVTWFHLEDVLASGWGRYLSLPPPTPTPPPNSPLPYTNQTLAGQWGLTTHDFGAGTVLVGANQSGELYATDPVSGVGLFLDEIRNPDHEAATVPRQPGSVAAPIRDLRHVVSALSGSASPPDRLQIEPSSAPGSSLSWAITCPFDNLTDDALLPSWIRGSTTTSDTRKLRNALPVVLGFAAFLGAGDVVAFGSPVANATQQLHWWGGDGDSMTNKIQGLYSSATQILETWSTSKPVPASAIFPNFAPTVPQVSWFGRGSGDRKDLRNEVRAWGGINQLQSLRVIDDAPSGSGPRALIVAATPGGSVTLLRPGRFSGTEDHGVILWDSADALPAWDEGNGSPGLAVRRVPGSTTGEIDIFLGILTTHLDPAPWLASSGPGKLVGGIAWYRWTPDPVLSTAGTVVRRGLLSLDPSSSNAIGLRGGFGVCGLAIVDVLSGTGNPGEELLATTLDGDLFVFAIPSSGMLSASDIRHRTWVPGALGVSNSIVAFDSDGDARNELFIAGSLGIWRWREL